MNKTAENLVKHEFGCYYLVDELEAFGPTFMARIREMATDSAKRIAWDGGEESAVPVARLLRSMANDPKHPLLEWIAEITLVDWPEGEAWIGFRQLAIAIAEQLERGSTIPAP